MKAIAHERRWFGYRVLHVLLKRQGHVVDHKRLFRLHEAPCGQPGFRVHLLDVDLATAKLGGIDEARRWASRLGRRAV